MGYEIIGVAMFGLMFMWLSTQKTIFEDSWRIFFFGFGFVNAILMFAFAAAPSAIILKAIAALIYLLIFLFVTLMYIFTNMAMMWSNTR